MSRPADRLSDIAPFRVVEVLSRAKALEAEGRDIVHMEAGEPDFATVQPIIDGAKAALDQGATYYTGACGIPELRQAISDLYRDRYQLSVPAERILVTPGASGALLLVAAYLMNPGDGMLMTDPGYPCNRNFIRLVEGESQLVPVDAAERYQLTPEMAERYWQSNTVGALVASPANPTGEILTREQLEGLHQVAARNHGSLIVDEIYHGLTFDVEAPSILEITDQAFVINSFSKFFGMTGWRLGWLVAPEQAVEGLERLAQNLFISMSTMGQFGALEGFLPESIRMLEARSDVFHQRRDFLVPALREIGFGIAHVPDGAFYVYADISAFSNDSLSFCKIMLEEHGVAITPGADFGNYKADTHVRFAYTTSMERLEEGVRRLRAVLKPNG